MPYIYIPSKLKNLMMILITLCMGISVHSGIDAHSFYYDQYLGDLKKSPTSSHSLDIFLREAFLLEHKGKNKDSIESYYKFFQKGGDGSFARYSYARLFHKEHDIQKALVQIEKAILLQPLVSKYGIYKIELLRKLKKNKEALSYAKKIHKKYGEIIPGIEFHLGELYYLKKKYNRSLFHFQQVLTLLQGTGVRKNVYRNVSLWRVSNLLIDFKQLEKAEAYLKIYINHNPRSFYARFVLAYYVYIPCGKFKKALSVFKKIHALTSSSFSSSRIPQRRFLSFYAFACYANHDLCFLKALQSIRKSNSLNSFEVAMEYDWFRKDKKSIRILLQLVRRNPTSMLVRYVLLNVLKRSKRSDLYMNSLLQTAKISYKNKRIFFLKHYLDRMDVLVKNHNKLKIHESDYYRLLSSYHFLKRDYHRAVLAITHSIRTLDQTKKRYAEIKNRQLLRRAFYMGQSKSNVVYQNGLLQSKKLADLDEIISADAKNITGILLMDQHDWKQALYYHAQYFKHTGNMNSRFWSGACYYELGQVEKSISIFEEVIQSKSSSRFHSLNYLAFYLAKHTTQLDRALKLAFESVEDNPFDYHRHDTLGYVYYKRKNYQQAFYHYKTALSLLQIKEKTIPEILTHLADVYEKTGDQKSARSWFKRAKSALERKRRLLSKRPLHKDEEKLQKRLEGMNL